MMVTCYKTKQPIIYNKGTKYEKTCDEFLACYGGTPEYINKLNTDPQAKAQFCQVHRLNENNISHFFINEQEEFN